jgi:hypothetical protein
MQLLNVSTLPIYLPFDQAHVPFGDPFEDASITSSVTAIVTLPGYDAPIAGQGLIFSDLTGSVESASLSAQVLYYIIAPIAGDTFAISATKGGAPLATTAAVAAGAFTAHLVTGETDGVPLPFKPNNTVLAVNQNAFSVTLMGANDKAAPVQGTYGGAPQGPSTLNVIASIAGGSMALVNLSYDWLQTSASGTISLIQN